MTWFYVCRRCRAWNVNDGVCHYCKHDNKEKR